GNEPTRVRKGLDGEDNATLLAVAGLERLGLMAHVTALLPLAIMLPAPGQGALAVQCRADDAQTLQLLAAIDDGAVRAAVTAERTFLHALGGGCSAPVAAYANFDDSATLHLQTLVAATDGQSQIRVVKSSKLPTSTTQSSELLSIATTVGQEAADEAMAQGATTFLAGLATAIAPPTTDGAAQNKAKPLAGKRIVVTRAETQADGFAGALADLGATTLRIPTICIEPLADLAPLDQALQRLDQYSWLILTSVNGVTIVAERLAALAIPAAVQQGARIAAVGQSTATALAAHGLTPTFVPERYVAEAIIDGLGDLAGRRILLPQAAIARETLADRLTAAGATVDAIPIYQTLPAVLAESARADLLQGVDLLTFTSSSTAQNFFAALEIGNGAPAAAKLAALGNPAIACIGPVTAETVRAFDLPVAIVAADHTIPGLIDALVAYYRARN
ncbi:MAG: uroporphyrinogen-III synthase, partial [Caldilineaceae bacterium]|nr:uroporphyrinogen-III synthase [Caldilineaceae bacterium]